MLVSGRVNCQPWGSMWLQLPPIRDDCSDVFLPRMIYHPPCFYLQKSDTFREKFYPSSLKRIFVQMILIRIINPVDVFFFIKQWLQLPSAVFCSTGRLFLFFESQENPSKISRDSSMEGWIRRWRCVGNPRRTPGVTTVDWRKVHSVDGSEIRLTTWDVLNPW